MTALDDGEAYEVATGLWPAEIHVHRFCSCPPGYCSRTCIECRIHEQADDGQLGAAEVAAW